MKMTLRECREIKQRKEVEEESIRREKKTNLNN